MRGKRRTLARGDRGRVTVDLALRLSEGLRRDRLAPMAETVLCPVRITITLDASARHIAVAIAVDNRARDHRLRALCETGTRALSHRAETAFGTTVRPVGIPSGRGWRERPNGDHATTGVVSVSGASRGLALGLDGLREYGIGGSGAQVAITLVRAVGWLSRGDLRERPGHVDAATPVPSAQCQGPRTHRYLVAPFGAPAELAAAGDEVRDAMSPVVLGRGSGAERSFVTVSGGAAELALLRAGPRRGTVALRLVNWSAAPSPRQHRLAAGMLSRPRPSTFARASRSPDRSSPERATGAARAGDRHGRGIRVSCFAWSLDARCSSFSRSRSSPSRRQPRPTMTFGSGAPRRGRSWSARAASSGLAYRVAGPGASRVRSDSSRAGAAPLP